MNRADLEKKAIEKAKKYKTQGFADKEFVKMQNGKNVRMFLPNSVFEQQKLLLLGNEVIENYNSFVAGYELSNKFYREIFKYKEGDFPIAEDVSKRTLALPFYNNLSEKEINFVIKNLKEVMEKIK